MLSFDIDGPDGRRACLAQPPTRSVPRDNYRAMKAGASASFSVLLGEVCPMGTFTRPGLYEITPTLHAQESGAELGLTAFTAIVPAQTATLLRLASAPEPFYKTPPAIVKTVTLNPAAAEDETD